jgi:hypothetical protein
MYGALYTVLYCTVQCCNRKIQYYTKGFITVNSTKIALNQATSQTSNPFTGTVPRKIARLKATIFQTVGLSM